MRDQLRHRKHVVFGSEGDKTAGQAAVEGQDSGLRTLAGG
jgi:hypothetical protein